MILVVVNNSYIVLRAILPSEDNPPLLIDLYAPEFFQIPFQQLKSIAWWNL